MQVIDMAPGAATMFYDKALRSSSFNGRVCLFNVNGAMASHRYAPGRVPLAAAAGNHVPSPERLSV